MKEMTTVGQVDRIGKEINALWWESHLFDQKAGKGEVAPILIG
jgi:hypothetical protein